MKKFYEIWESFKKMYSSNLEQNSCSAIVNHMKISLINFAENNNIMSRDQMEQEMETLEQNFLASVVPGNEDRSYQDLTLHLAQF